MKRFAKITTRFEALHRYPTAPEDVAFLRNTHRHIFHVVVWIEQFHDNREVEYIRFKRWLEGELPRDGADLGSMSCEHIASQILDVITTKYEGRQVSVEVSEDGENGALVENIGD